MDMHAIHFFKTSQTYLNVRNDHSCSACRAGQASKFTTANARTCKRCVPVMWELATILATWMYVCSSARRTALQIIRNLRYSEYSGGLSENGGTNMATPNIWWLPWMAPHGAIGLWVACVLTRISWSIPPMELSFVAGAFKIGLVLNRLFIDEWFGM